MLPFIHIGPFRFASYGIMMATGLFIGYYMLRADLRRRELQLNPLVLVLTIGLSGLLASKLYLALESPALFLSNPAFLLNRAGYTFYGAVLGAVGVVFVLARHYRLNPWSLFDAVSAEAALGYGIGRIGCLLAGDGDYGIPTTLPWGMSFPHGLVPTLARVHPTPIYEFIVAALIAAYLWRRGGRILRDPAAAGEVFAHYLVLTGAARFLVEYLRLNPPVLWGLSNAQCVAVVSIAAGVVLQIAVWLRRRAPVSHSSADEPARGSIR